MHVPLCTCVDGGGALKDRQLGPREAERLGFITASLKRVTCPHVVWVEGAGRQGGALWPHQDFILSHLALPPLSQCPEAQYHVLPAVPSEGDFRAVSCLSELTKDWKARGICCEGQAAVAAEDGEDL